MSPRPDRDPTLVWREPVRPLREYGLQPYVVAAVGDRGRLVWYKDPQRWAPLIARVRAELVQRVPERRELILVTDLDYAWGLLAAAAAFAARDHDRANISVHPYLLYPGRPDEWTRPLMVPWWRRALLRCIEKGWEPQFGFHCSPGTPLEARYKRDVVAWSLVQHADLWLTCRDPRSDVCEFGGLGDRAAAAGIEELNLAPDAVRLLGLCPLVPPPRPPAPPRAGPDDMGF